MSKDTGERGERYSSTPTPDVLVRHEDMVSTVAAGDILAMSFEEIMAQTVVPPEMTPKEAQKHREEIATKRLPELMRNVDKLFSLVLREIGVKRDVDESPEGAEPEAVINHAITSLERVAAPYGVPVQKWWFRPGNIFTERKQILQAIETADAASMHFTDTPRRQVEDLIITVKQELRDVVKELALLKAFYRGHGIMIPLRDHIVTKPMDYEEHRSKALAEGERRSKVQGEVGRLFVEKGFFKLSADELRETIKEYELTKASFDAARERLIEPARSDLPGVRDRLKKFDEIIERDWMMIGFLEHRLRDIEAGRATGAPEAPSEAVTAPGGSGKPAPKPYQMPRDVPKAQPRPGLFARFGGTVRAAMIGLTALIGASDRPEEPEAPRAEPVVDVAGSEGGLQPPPAPSFDKLRTSSLGRRGGDADREAAEEEQMPPMRQLVDVKATVVAGDTVWAIAKRRLREEGVARPKDDKIATKMNEIIAINHLSSDGDIVPGQALVVARELVKPGADESSTSSRASSDAVSKIEKGKMSQSIESSIGGGPTPRQDTIDLAKHETIWSTARAMLEESTPDMRVSNERVELVTALMLVDSNIKAAQSLSLKPGTPLNVGRTKRIIAELSSSSKPNLREIALREGLGWPPNVLRRFKR